MESKGQRIRTTKAAIAQYWLESKNGTDHLPDNAALLDPGEPTCFACGWPATKPDVSPRLWSVWNRARLDRCHLVPRALGGDDAPSNLVLLCSDCHREAPDVADPRYMLRWIARRESRWERWTRAIHTALDDAGLRAPAGTLVRDEDQGVLDWLPEFLRGWAGLHGPRVSDATVGAVAVEVVRRAISEEDRSTASGTVHHVTESEVIGEIGRRLAGAVPPGSRIVLFGSRARGQSGDGSDYDVLVIEPSPENAARESVRLRAELDALSVPVDVVVVDEAIASRRARVAGTMIERALREGRELART